MQHLPVLDVMERAIREVVCTRCFMRPHGSEAYGPEVARSCEGDCTIFMNLPQLRRIAEATADASPGLFERAIRNTICAKCHHCMSAGDFCAQHLAETCPISVYGKLVLETLDRVRESVGP
jgi:hypothetical protein